VIPTPSPGATVTPTSRRTPSATDAASPSPFRTPSTTPKPLQGSFAPDGARIAFASDRDPDSGGNDVYVIDVQTGEVTRLTTGGGIDEYPTW
jgi:hypothetical protein